MIASKPDLRQHAYYEGLRLFRAVFPPPPKAFCGLDAIVGERLPCGGDVQRHLPVLGSSRLALGKHPESFEQRRLLFGARAAAEPTTLDPEVCGGPRQYRPGVRSGSHSPAVRAMSPPAVDFIE